MQVERRMRTEVVASATCSSSGARHLGGSVSKGLAIYPDR